jgi:hypothetical protein
MLLFFSSIVFLEAARGRGGTRLKRPVDRD